MKTRPLILHPAAFLSVLAAAASIAGAQVPGQPPSTDPARPMPPPPADATRGYGTTAAGNVTTGPSGTLNTSAPAPADGFFSAGGRIYLVRDGRAAPLTRDVTLRVSPNGITGFDGAALTIPPGQMFGTNGTFAPLPSTITGLPPGTVTALPGMTGPSGTAGTNGFIPGTATPAAGVPGATAPTNPGAVPPAPETPGTTPGAATPGTTLGPGAVPANPPKPGNTSATGTSGNTGTAPGNTSATGTSGTSGTTGPTGATGGGTGGGTGGSGSSGGAGSGTSGGTGGR